MSSEALLGVYAVLLIGALIGPTVLNGYLKNQYRINREKEINIRQGEWGTEICRALVNGEIQIGMTHDMVRLALGSPTIIDQQKTTEKQQQERWVYGIPKPGKGGGGANYVIFKNGEVSKTIVNRPFEISKGGFNPIIVSFLLLIVLVFILVRNN
jgi:hypothetical protein